MRLVLVVPELIWPEPEDSVALGQLSCPALEKLLARGRCERSPRQAHEDALAAAFGFAADAPFGALRLLGEAGAADDARQGFWLCADPVHLRFHHERIILADAGAFELSDDEARSLAAGLNAEFSDIGEFQVADRRRWYVRLHAACDYAALPLSAVAGRRVDGELPQRGGTAKLRAWLNEVQMFLHDHPVNTARQNSGQPPVNSLWLWGAGALAESADPGFDSVWARDPLARGLARAAGIPARPLPPDFTALAEHADPAGRHLLFIDDLLAPTLYEDGAGWRDALLSLEKRWFAPLAGTLGGRLSRLEVLAPTIYGRLAWHLAGADRWKFWRRPRPLADLAHEFAA